VQIGKAYLFKHFTKYYSAVSLSFFQVMGSVRIASNIDCFELRDRFLKSIYYLR